MCLALPVTHDNVSPTTAITADPAIGSSETCVLGSNSVDQDACDNVPEPATIAAGTSAAQPSTGTEPTLDELIEAYIAFDEYWQYEQNMRVKFVTNSIARANTNMLASMRKRRKVNTAPTSHTQQTDSAEGLGTITSSALDMDDRRIIPSEFQKLQDLLGINFTLDACATADGSNALCSNYCSADDSFLTRDLANEIVWLNPPFAQLSTYLDHFLEQKQAHPELSGAILVPAWRTIQQHPLFAQYSRLVKTYPKGYYLFDSPNRATGASARRRLPGTPWPVQIWFCPPTAPATLQELEQPAKLPMAYKCLVNKAKATALLDTGAKGTAFLSKRFCDLYGVVTRRSQHVADTVELADGTDVETFGTATITVHLQSLRVKHLECIVCDLTPHFDLILGSDWLVDHKAILDLAAATCTFVH